MRYQNVGLQVYDRVRATPGFTLISRLRGCGAYLIGMKGDVVHEWALPYPPGDIIKLLPNGNLLAALDPKDDEPFNGEAHSRFKGGKGPPLRGGRGGLIHEYDWDGTLVWEYKNLEQHHDVCRLPNGNTLYIGWEIMPAKAANRVQGGVPGTEHNGNIYGDYLHEVTPEGEVVWEWHAHSDMEIERYPICGVCHRNEFAHANACFPMPNGDVMLSFRRINLVAIVDRETRKFSWERRDDSWGHQHDCQKLDNGNILIFANGIHWTGGQAASRVIEFDPGSGDTEWEYQGSPPFTFFSPHISGMQRLASGNTLICEGQWGRVFEVTPDREIVWEFISPFFAPAPGGGLANMMFRAYRYGADSPEIGGRLGRI